MIEYLHSLPKEDGFWMPAEFGPRAATILIWPTRPGSWGKDPSEAEYAFTRVIRELSAEEKVYVLADGEGLARARGKVGDRAEILEIPTNDAWARDVGPTFVTDGKRVRGVNWRFNAWGGDYDGLYADWALDDQAAGRVLEKLGYAGYDAGDFVLEGGSVHADGEGTLLVTEACLLSPGRNPGLSRGQIAEKLKDYLGVRKILWLPRGIYGDETNEHVDNMCAFTKPGEVLLAWTDNENDPQYALSQETLVYLEKERDAAGRKLKITKLPIPDYPILLTEEDVEGYAFEPGEDTREAGERMAASYVNFYFGKKTILAPVFGGVNEKSDQRALSILRKACPDRKVIGVPAMAILQGGGNIHCVTQQIPEGARG